MFNTNSAGLFALARSSAKHGVKMLKAAKKRLAKRPGKVANSLFLDALDAFLIAQFWRQQAKRVYSTERVAAIKLHDGTEVILANWQTNTLYQTVQMKDLQK